jgi:hypothetical protein
MPDQIIATVPETAGNSGVSLFDFLDMPKGISDPLIFVKPGKAEQAVEGKDPNYLYFEDAKPVKSSDKGDIYAYPSRYHGKSESGFPLESTDLYVNDKTVIVKTVSHSEGVSKTDKKWHRWQTTRTIVFSLKQERFGMPHLRIYEILPKRKTRHRTFRDVSRSYNIPQLHTSWSMSRKNVDHIQHAIAGKVYVGSKEDSYAGGVDSSAAYYHALYHVARKYKELGGTIDLSAIDPKNLFTFLAYPSLRMFQSSNLKNIAFAVQANSSAWLHEPDVRVFVRKVFGKKAVRKDVIKAVAKTTDALAISICSYIKNYVPADWIRDLLNDPDKYRLITPAKTRAVWDTPSEVLYPELKKLFKNASEHEKRKLVFLPADDDKNSERMFTDSLLSLSKISEEDLVENWKVLDFTNWKTLHDKLAIVHRNIKIKPVPIPQDGLTGLLDGKTFQGLNPEGEEKTYTISSPKVNHDLYEWGNEMSNCIASYNDRVLRNETYVFAVYEGKTLFANIEIYGERVRQFYAKYNGRVEPHLHAALQVVLDSTLLELRAQEEAAEKKKKSKRKTAV